MSDPLTILGAAASITTLIEVLSKTVIAIHSLHTRYASADFTLLNLIAQLTALKAALSRLQEWLNTDIDEVHHQLVMDLEVSVTCCRMLVKRIGDEIDGLGTDEEGGLDMKGKFKLIMKNGGLEELQKMVDRQTGALGLLLTVCNCVAISDQKILLEKNSTRRVFTRVRDDTSSLYVLRDSNSLYSRCTDNLSKFSKTFDFDSELFLSKVYGKAIRGTMKETLGKIRPEKRHLYEVTREERQQNEIVENEILKDRMTRRNICSVLVLGDRNSARRFMGVVESLFPEEISHKEHEERRNLVMRSVLLMIQNMINVMNDSKFVLDDTAQANYKILLQEIDHLQAGGRVTVDGVNALQSLRQEKINQTFILDPGLREKSPPTETYLVQEVQRIAQSDYLPTNDDIRELDQTSLAKDRIEVYKFQIEGLCYHIINASSQGAVRKKWISHFENPDGIVIFVDLAQYDEFLKPSQSKLQENMDLFDFVVNSGLFKHLRIDLFLCNLAAFKERLETEPLAEYFPDYSGGADVHSATEYLLSHFSRLNRSDLELCHHLVEPADTLSIRLILVSVNDNIIQNNLRLCGLFGLDKV